MASYRSLGALGGDADLILRDRFPNMSDNFALNPADLVRMKPTAAHPNLGAPSDLFHPQSAPDKKSHPRSGTGSTSDPLLLFLDPALGGDGPKAVAVPTKQRPYAAKRSISRTTAASSKTRSNRRSLSGEESKAVSPVTAYSPEESVEPMPLLKKRTKKSKSKTVAVKVEFQEDDKRNQFLERNRAAASKCRKKKKVWMTNLEEAKQTAARQHDQLRSQYNGLVNEVGKLKNMIMSHASCKSNNINKWIEHEAQRFVKSTNWRLERTGLEPPQPQVPRGYCQGRAFSATSLAGNDHSYVDVASGMLSDDIAAMDIISAFALDTSNFDMDVGHADLNHMPLSMLPSTIKDIKAYSSPNE